MLYKENMRLAAVTTKSIYGHQCVGQFIRSYEKKFCEPNIQMEILQATTNIPIAAEFNFSHEHLQQLVALYPAYGTSFTQDYMDEFVMHDIESDPNDLPQDDDTLDCSNSTEQYSGVVDAGWTSISYFEYHYYLEPVPEESYEIAPPFNQEAESSFMQDEESEDES